VNKLSKLIINKNLFTKLVTLSFVLALGYFLYNNVSLASISRTDALKGAVQGQVQGQEASNVDSITLGTDVNAIAAKLPNDDKDLRGKIVSKVDKANIKDFKGASVNYDANNDLVFSRKSFISSVEPSRFSDFTNTEVAYKILPGDLTAERIMVAPNYQNIANKENLDPEIDYSNILDIDTNVKLGTGQALEIGAAFSPYFARLSSASEARLDFETSSLERPNLKTLVNSFKKTIPAKVAEKDKSAAVQKEKIPNRVFPTIDPALTKPANELRLPYFNEFIRSAVYSKNTILPVYSGFAYVSKSSETEVCLDFLVQVFRANEVQKASGVELEQAGLLSRLFTAISALLQGPALPLYTIQSKLCANDIYAAVKMDAAKEVLNFESILNNYTPEAQFSKVFTPTFYRGLQENGLNGSYSQDSSAPTSNSSYVRQSLLSLENVFTCNDLSSSGKLVKALDDNYASRCSSASGQECTDYSSLRVQITEKTDCLNTSTRFMVSPTIQNWCAKGWLTGKECVLNVAPQPTEICIQPEPINLPADPIVSVNDSNAAGAAGVDAANFISPLPTKNTVDFAVRSGTAAQAHPGIDIGAPIGTRVQAIADGRCVYASEVSSASQSNYLIWSTNKNPTDPANEGLQAFGRVVMLEHTLTNGRRIYALYAHLSQISEKIRNCSYSANTTVRQGDTLGATGNAGRSWSPHLHFEIRLKRDRASFNNQTYYYTGPTGNDQGCGQDYCNPKCLITSPDNCSFGSSPVTGPPTDPGNPNPPSNPKPPVLAPVSPGPQICTVIDPINPIEPDESGNPSGPINPNDPVITPTVSTTTPYTRESLIQRVSGSCSNMAPFITDQSPQLVNLYINTTIYAEQNGLANGTRNAQQLFGSAYSPDIYGLLKRVSELTGVPSYKIATHMFMERFGYNGRNLNVIKEGSIKSYNGNVDQVDVYPANPLSRVNLCGCVGPSQFCPSGASKYLYPNSPNYGAIKTCVEGLGINQPTGQPINIAYMGAATCALATKLKFDTGGNTGVAWDSGCCSGETFNKNSCRHYKAARAYAGASEDPVIVRYYDESSNICRADSIISQFKRISPN